MAKLQRDAVIAAALDLLNEAGVDGLTTRKLAERLGVQQPALYWHFKSKQALLDALSDAMMRGHIHTLPSPGGPWKEFLYANARSFRRALLAYRDGARIHAGTRPAEPQYDRVQAQIKLLCDAGFTPLRAANALVAISHYVVGSVMEQQAGEAAAPERVAPPVPPPALARTMKALDRQGPDATFEYGLAMMLDGLSPDLP
ncbi:tetracycline resistance transcriptional repressor TetR [Achromobacter xylosoxidans]|uniref:tetracycline resistance transcriptional repressor TetR n=1 Tax=Alcaligenes xylosoxydans xylosoxydans TaxID=85698 RepID=UPI00292F2899|nr:tetracycline resistance transcriptional repressor TetR [Achromobacter xylosoxidans]WOB76210.1 tetracycline resistance transcriptional repressor TetR [Achromobacter xylosoxidans]